MTVAELIAAGKIAQIPKGTKILFVDSNAVNLDELDGITCDENDPLAGAYLVPVRCNGRRTIQECLQFIEIEGANG